MERASDTEDAELCSCVSIGADSKVPALPPTRVLLLAVASVRAQHLCPSTLKFVNLRGGLGGGGGPRRERAERARAGAKMKLNPAHHRRAARDTANHQMNVSHFNMFQ